MSKKNDTTKQNLLPCPFCGRKGRLTSVDEGRFYLATAKHKANCYLHDEQPPYYYAVDKLKLVADWNRRA